MVTVEQLVVGCHIHILLPGQRKLVVAGDSPLMVGHSLQLHLLGEVGMLEHEFEVAIAVGPRHTIPVHAVLVPETGSITASQLTTNSKTTHQSCSRISEGVCQPVAAE